MKSDFWNLFCVSQLLSAVVPPSPLQHLQFLPTGPIAFQVSPVSSNRCSPHSSPWPWCSLQHWTLSTPELSCPLSLFFSAFPAIWTKSACAVAGGDLHELFLLFLIGALILVSLLLNLWSSFLEINLCNSNPPSGLVEVGQQYLRESETERK